MYTIITLDNGLRIVYEKIPFVRSIAAGIWVGTGSRNEDSQNNGVSHFVEHMLFKGTNTRSAKDIAESFDSIGGQINAFTGKECTCYYAKTLDSHIEIAFEVLADMFFNSKFAPSDIDVEKRVILEEINMYEDSPEEMVHDLLSEISWSGDSLGYSILGTNATLAKMGRETMVSYIENSYNPWNTVIAIAGNFDEKAMVELVKKHFDGWKKTKKGENAFKEVSFDAQTKYKEKDTEQVHVCIGFKGIEHGNEDLYPLLAVNNVFGGGMSSRLFQKVREEHGLVYSIYSYPSSYSNAGIFNIYAGMNPDCMEKVLELVAAEVMEIRKNGITAQELSKTKEQLKGNYILGLESTSSRMNSIGKSLLLLDKIYTPEEVLKKIDDISIETTKQIIDKVFDLEKISMAVVGKFSDKYDFRNMLR